MVINNNLTGGFGAPSGDALFDDLSNEKERIEKGTEEFKKELIEKWKTEHLNDQIFPEKIAAMHPDVVDFLLKFDLVNIYDSIAKQCNLDQKQRNELPHIVWELAQTKKWSELQNAVQNKIVQGSGAQLASQLIEKNILSAVKKLAEKPIVKREVSDYAPKKVLDTLKFEDALQKYPKAGEQLITTNLIKLRIFPSPVRPSIKNWMTDYHDFVGSGNHNAVDRGSYIFQSANGKSLTPMERERVSNMLKIIDQNENVSVDVEKEMIVFAATPIEAPKTSAAKGDAYVTKMHSSSGPRMQNESTQKPDPASGEQEDVFDRYAKKSFSPNFANKQEFVVSKRGDMQKSVEQFRKAAAPTAEEVPVFHGSEDFHDFGNAAQEAKPPIGGLASREKENETEGQVSFSTPQIFSVERKVEVQKPAPAAEIAPQPQIVAEQKPAEQAKRVAPTYRKSWHIASSSSDSSDSDDKN